MGALLISLLVCLAFIYSYGNPVRLVSPHGCEEIQIDLCKSLPYNSTLLPNSYEQDRQTTVNRTLWDLVQRINAVVCSDDLIFYFCSLYLPICVKSKEIRKPIKPCRSVCEKVKRDCRATLESLPDGHQSFPEFQCGKLEDYDKGVCLKPEAFVVSTSNLGTLLFIQSHHYRLWEKLSLVFLCMCVLHSFFLIFSFDYHNDVEVIHAHHFNLVRYLNDMFLNDWCSSEVLAK